MRLDNKIALVTGAASGFGEGIARRFAIEGAKVIIADIDHDKARLVAESIGKGADFISVDVSDKNDTERMISKVNDLYGRLNIFVQNAAIGMQPTPLIETPLELFDKLFKINVRSVYLGAVHAVPLMKTSGKNNVIINTISTAALRPRPGLTAYNSTKGALVTMTKGLALELASYKIRVNGLCPVAGETPMLKDFLGKGDQKQAHAKFVSTVPLGRLAEPRDMANAALYLASDEADFISGVLLEVDGGRCI